MAIVPNKDGMSISANGHPTGPIDVSYSVPSLVGTGVPSVASLFSSQVALDTVTGVRYTSLGKGSTQWVEFS
jgi:hypothetical protein